MNNVDTGYDTLWVDTTCHSVLTMHIPLDKDTFKVIELNRAELTEFLWRTRPLEEQEK